MEHIAEEVINCISKDVFNKESIECFWGIGSNGNFIFNDEVGLKCFSLLFEERRKEDETTYQPVKGKILNYLENVWCAKKNFKGTYGKDYVALLQKVLTLITTAPQYFGQANAGEDRNHFNVLTVSLCQILNSGKRAACKYEAACKSKRENIVRCFRKVCKDRGGNQRKFWSTIKPYLNSRNSTNDSRIVLKDNDMIIRDPQAVAETPNNFFTSVAREETGQAKPTPDCSHISDLSRIQQNLPAKPPLSLEKTNSAEVKEAMMKIKTNKATGCDQIPPRAIKASAEVLCHPFSELFNYILNKSRIP